MKLMEQFDKRFRIKRAKMIRITDLLNTSFYLMENLFHSLYFYFNKNLMLQHMFSSL